ncbi:MULTISPECIES: methyl-accepting chemotaxis protein [Silvimonas]|uniref:methyl-accepting chemotaxis protein n=1 Tax=Silvimonas TaxID=300264 RepID=UPI0024B33A31|nr:MULTISPECIES: methyl-accepting chemotaxis protein [Silvimonas]MDR3428020.1 methyl-accepting chemotaxis protein [Silvimonas sp.]
MSIGHRLIAMIAVALAAVLVIGATGMYQFSQIQSGVTRLMDDDIDSMLIANDLNNSYKVEQIELGRLILEQNPDNRVALSKGIAETREKLKTQIGSYEKSRVHDDEDTAAFGAFKTSLNQLHTVFDQIIKASEAGDNATAITVAGTQGRDVSIEVEKTLEKVSAYNVNRAQKEQAGIDQRRHTAQIWFIAVIAVAALVLIAGGIVLYNAIRQPLNAMKKTFTQVQQNLDFTLRVPLTRRDEIGAAVRAFNQLLDGLQNSLQGIHQQIRQVAGAATDMSRSAAEMSGNATNTSEAASNMAATVEQVTVSITHVADRAGEANELSRHSGKLAQTGSQVIESTVSRIEGIAGTVRTAADEIGNLQTMSGQINAVVKVIKEIADQTNLLALNAAIEAARAGEQGRGFAVVADEVRKLAERTSASTQEISATVSSIQDGALRAVSSMQEVVSRMEDGVDHARQAGQAIIEIRHGANDVVERVDDISTAIQEQSAASNNIAQLVERIAQMSEGNSASARHTASAAQQLHQLAGDMQREVERYRV